MNIFFIYKKAEKFLSNNIINLSFLLFFIFFLSYETSFAAETFKGIIERVVGTIIKPIGGLFVIASLVSFIWGVTKYMRGGEIEKEGARSLMFWGLIGLAVITSVSGFVAALKNTLGI